MDPRLSVYLNSIENDLPDQLEELENRALDDFVPIIRRESQSVIKMLIALTEPRRVLEIGSGIGFSALLMRNEMLKIHNEFSITTIEYFKPRIPQIRENFRSFGASEIELIEGDALDILPELTGEYDFIFLDAAKAQYINMLPHIKRLMHKGSVLVTDNVLQEGEILDSRYTIKQRDRTIYSRMREYLYSIKHDDELETAIIANGDGMSVSVKK